MNNVLYFRSLGTQKMTKKNKNQKWVKYETRKKI